MYLLLEGSTVCRYDYSFVGIRFVEEEKKIVAKVTNCFFFATKYN